MALMAAYICRICGRTFEEIPPSAVELPASHSRGGWHLWRFPDCVHDLKLFKAAIAAEEKQ